MSPPVTPTTASVGNQWRPCASCSGKSHKSFWSWRKFAGSCRTETSRPAAGVGELAAGACCAGDVPWGEPSVDADDASAGASIAAVEVGAISCARAPAAELHLNRNSERHELRSPEAMPISPTAHDSASVHVPCVKGLRQNKVVVPEEGVEPTRPCDQRILSPPRLPFRHSGTRLGKANLLRHSPQDCLRHLGTPILPNGLLALRSQRKCGPPRPRFAAPPCQAASAKSLASRQYLTSLHPYTSIALFTREDKVLYKRCL